MDETFERRQRYSARYGARDPWLAGGLRASAYLLWRALFGFWRPLIFAALVVAALALFWRAAALTAATLPPPAPSLSDQAVLAVGDPETWWTAALDRALDPGAGRAPDLPLANALEPVLPALAGRERLAYAAMLDNGRTMRGLEAELRAEPAWRRQALLDAALAERLGGDQASLIDGPFRARYDRAQALYGPAIGAVETWFGEPGGRALVLNVVPGLETAPGGAALYGDVRDVLVQGCALAEASGRRVGQCRVVFLPKPNADLLQTGLALATAQAEGQARIGARVLKAAAAAGIADRDFLSSLVLGRDEAMAREAALASAMSLMSRAGDHYTRPVFASDLAGEAGAEFLTTVRTDRAARDQVFRDFARIRRDAGALAAVRMADIVRSPDDAVKLARLAQQHGPAVLGLHAALGARLLELESPHSEAFAIEIPQEAVRFAGAGGGVLLLAFALLFWVMIAGYRRARGGAPGAVERLDGAVTRLILGRNS